MGLCSCDVLLNLLSTQTQFHVNPTQEQIISADNTEISIQNYTEVWAKIRITAVVKVTHTHVASAHTCTNTQNDCHWS